MCSACHSLWLQCSFVQCESVDLISLINWYLSQCLCLCFTGAHLDSVSDTQKGNNGSDASTGNVQVCWLSDETYYTTDHSRHQERSHSHQERSRRKQESRQAQEAGEQSGTGKEAASQVVDQGACCCWDRQEQRVARHCRVVYLTAMAKMLAPGCLAPCNKHSSLAAAAGWQPCLLH
jgi:hypothetical protein